MFVNGTSIGNDDGILLQQ